MLHKFLSVRTQLQLTHKNNYPKLKTKYTEGKREVGLIYELRNNEEVSGKGIA